MCKKSLRDTSMSTAEVMQAKNWMSRLVQLESRGPGDTENAMRRLSRRYGIEYGALWSLRYRSPRRVWADIYNALGAAYARECERQREVLAHELAVTQAIVGPQHGAVVAAEAVVGAHSRSHQGR